ncbi:Pentatricopeptide repeat-containing-like protein [Gossypium australe]|uniref:Pentatricopeptide repeat-containing-like protein n=1 Tax=Gossypium australe TaxID=47621 RepID=A0A5B6WNA9_9ROSI|nr:Pentatricopeptide repeat-containing-like protein [Gossypium australe]
MIPNEILYRCEDFDWVPLLGIWGDTTRGLAQCEFAYKGDNYKKKVREISNAWNQTHKMKRFAANPMKTPKYDWRWGKRINDNVFFVKSRKYLVDKGTLASDTI